eukprot:TRINITY_DN7802_c0_g1_i10.p1 TRINITY_DN7802_c0_g1~~TRINITY_DN7802_c0_g1_i10.p1  ORF type:complete len:555 (+),score=131.45 TRINITY_DN7802_c0_g1_i10:54-1718(+)
MEDPDQERVSRFAHLLQPIRDLAENWSIDIARELEEYLDELEHVTISFDDGKTNVNFAEAALLIQSSACIYSKKVEFLYNMVFQTLDYLAEKRRTTRKDHAHDASMGDQEANFHEEPEFLTLDDVLEVDKNINLVEKNGDQASIPVPKLQRAPIALLSIEDEKKDHANPLQGLKILSCQVSRTGALLLEGQTLPDDAIVPAPYVDIANAVTPAILPESHQDGPLELPDDDFEGNDGDSASIDHSNRINSFQGESLMVTTSDINTSNPAAVPVVSKKAPKKVEAPSDPWAPLDPHQEMDHLLKPFKKGKTFQIPNNTDEDPVDDYKPKFSFRKTAFPEFQYLFKREIKRQSIMYKSQLAKTMSERQPSLSSIPQAILTSHDYGFEVGDDFDDRISDDDFDDPPPPPIPMDLPDPATFEQTYEDLCRMHAESYLRGAEQYAEETALSRRVAEWQEKLRPTLEEQESRKPFDIHSYGQKIVTFLDNVKEKEQAPKAEPLPFSVLVKETAQTNYDICRYFLATLQLVSQSHSSDIWHPKACNTDHIILWAAISFQREP